ncbi:hypothetical protein BLOT_007568 [Blomia tropicalis]|nr:hypothetical protein BLOT_007568 [Blomia tropicalis]
MNKSIMVEAAPFGPFVQPIVSANHSTITINQSINYDGGGGVGVGLRSEKFGKGLRSIDRG